MLWRRDPVLELQIVAVVCCHSIVFCNSVSADRSGMAASRFTVAAAACVILVPFAAESRKFHIFTFWELKEASHESCVFTHHGCDLNVRIWRKHCVFRINGASAAEKSMRARRVRA